MPDKEIKCIIDLGPLKYHIRIGLLTPLKGEGFPHLYKLELV